MDWWKTAFDEKYIKTYTDRLLPERTSKEVRFLVRVLQLTKKTNILDVACGYGRHALEFARCGYRVTGIDQSAYLINQARREAKKQKLSSMFRKMDMRRLVLDKKFDIAINLFTSFGYFNTKQDDIAVLKGIKHVLNSSGRLLIDIANPERKIRMLKKDGALNQRRKILTKISESKLSNGLMLRVRETFDIKKLRWRIFFSWYEGRKKISYHADVHLFTAVQLKRLLRQVGFRPLRTWGDFDGKSFHAAKSPRIIILAQKFAASTDGV
jgi:SAM-dependent methyltransferase